MVKRENAFVAGMNDTQVEHTGSALYSSIRNVMRFMKKVSHLNVTAHQGKCLGFTCEHVPCCYVRR